MKIYGKRLGLFLAVFMLVLFQPLTAQAAIQPMEAIGIPVDAADVTCVSLLNDTSIAPFDLPENSFYYGRNALAKMSNSTALLYAYDAIAAGVEDCAEKIRINNGSTLTLSELHIIMDAYRRDYAHHFWLGSAYSYTYNPVTGIIYDLIPGYYVGENFVAGYLLSGAELTEAKAAFEQEIEEILGGMDADWSDFEKELYFHDLLAARVTYITEGTHIYNAYGALVEGEAVCEGYAEALQVLLHRAGIQSFLMIGKGYNAAEQIYENHEWNAVCIDDQWYHVDVTWDDQDSDIYHAYFNVSDDVIKEEHQISETAYRLPICDSMDANYFTVMGGKVTAFDAEAIGELLKEQGLTVHLYATGSMTADSLCNAIESEIRDIAAAADIKGAFSYSRSWMGREVVLRIIPAGISGEIRSINADSIQVSVHGLFENDTTADLYIAVYEENGRMIGIEKASDQVLSVGGSSRTVTFSGEAHSVGIFALDGSGIPLDDAVPLEIE